MSGQAERWDDDPGPSAAHSVDEGPQW